MNIEGKLLEFISTELQVPSDVLTVDYELIANRVVDSLGLLQIVSFLESEYEIEVADEELVPDHFATVAAIVSLVESKIAERNGGIAAVPQESRS